LQCLLGTGAEPQWRDLIRRNAFKERCLSKHIETMKASDKTNEHMITEVEHEPRRIPKLERSSSKLKRVEKTLWKSEEKLRNIFENINDVVFRLSPAGIIEYVSPRVQELYGYKPEELIGKHLRKTTPKSEMPKALKILKTALAGKLVKNLEIDQLDKNGKIVHMEIIGIPVKKNGTIIAVQGIMRDITERKESDDAQRETSLFLRNILDSSSSISIVFTDPEQNILFWNKGAENIFGYKAEEVVGHHTVDILYPDEEKDIKQTVKEIRSFVLNKKRGIRRELKEVTKDGRTLWISLTSTPRLDENGNVIGILGIGEDITDRKQAEEMLQKAHQELEKRVEERTAELSETNMLLKQEISERKQMEEALRDSAEKYRFITSTAMDGFAVTDLDGRIVDVNEESCRILGYSREEQLKMSISDLEAVKTPNEIKTHIQKVTEIGSDRFETRHRRKDGRIIDIEVSMTFMPQSKHFLVFHRDISERKQAVEHLKESFERLRRSLESTVSALASAFEVRDPYTAGHQQRVTDLACAIAEEMGLSEEQIDGIRMAGLIHDIGKINIPAEILNKPGQLTEIEYSLFKNHPQVGHDVLQTVEFPWPVAKIVLQHHERMDGSGYPQGLSGDEIMLEARILAVADIVEAIASHRPYRPARGAGDALEEILHNKGTMYDPEVVDACLRVFYEKGFKFEHVLQVATLPRIH
jgi:PAS domain S-box-containing protein/putative nucleotidyltransferase with HDIG domain